MEKTYRQYLADREELLKGRKDKFVCLMDLALMAMRKLKAEGKLADQEESMRSTRAASWFRWRLTVRQKSGW